MAKLDRQQIQELVLRQLEDARGGTRWSVILRAIHDEHSETPINNIAAAAKAILNSNPAIVKVYRGTYQLAKYQDAQASSAVAVNRAAANEPIQVETSGQNVRVTLTESDFYESFAQWLVDDAEVVNVAVSLGGSVLKGKWGTPDVLGVLKPRAQDILKFETQIVSAEIKIDPSQPVVAFGQAVAYRLFSHKSYIVIPNTTSEDDLSRLTALCTIHGVGLVTFAFDKTNPNFNVLVLPAQASPDMFYANQMLRRLLDSNPGVFNKLFS